MKANYVEVTSIACSVGWAFHAHLTENCSRKIADGD